jgi:hypothetical protein
MKLATVRSRVILSRDRLDAHFFTSSGVEVGERLTLLEAAGTATVRLGDIAHVWDPPRFARAYAAPAEPGLPYLSPYDIFEYLPVASARLSVSRNDDLERLQPRPGTLLQTCSGRNLGPCTIADEMIGRFALSHDMIRIEIDDERMRLYVLAFLKTPTGQALLRRGKSGSVIDHITVPDVASLPIPVVDSAAFSYVTSRVRKSVRAVAEARARLTSALESLESTLPMPSRRRPLRDGWSVPARSVAGRLDAAFYDPYVRKVRSQLLDSGGLECGDLSAAFLPVRYKRYYVDKRYGRPILSGRQILQLEPINLQWVSDRSFRDPEQYVIAKGTTVMAADGRAQGSQGSAALVTAERNGWLASNHVMRLHPRRNVRPGAVWLAMASRHVRTQVNALSFGSVVDQLNPTDVERVIVPVVDDGMARGAEKAWASFSRAAVAMRDAVDLLQGHLAS